MNNQQRKDKIKLLQDLQKGKTNIKKISPAIRITLVYKPDGNVAIISNDDGRMRAVKSFTDSTKDALIEKVKKDNPQYRVDVYTLPVERYLEFKERFEKEY